MASLATSPADVAHSVKIVPANRLGLSFYHRPAIELAPLLLGNILVRRVGGCLLRCRIVETEAYIGAHDLACHAARGRTARNDVMFGPPGRVYVYFIYGMYYMLNIVAGDIGDPQAVLIRAAAPLDGWEANLSGPGRLARELMLNRQHNGLSLASDELFLQRDAAHRPKVRRTPRIGVDYAGHWARRLLRFVDIHENSRRYVSGRKV
ncbi:MAG: DNA-3-methyladenine glycosylase [Phycisphaerales bacterium]|nr:DNA-3-methyladenine glycosylase [Phycisphaerales bacterium]